MVRWNETLQGTTHDHSTRNLGGLALIALSIYFSIGSLPVNASGGVQKIAIYDKVGQYCVDTYQNVLNVKSVSR